MWCREVLFGGRLEMAFRVLLSFGQLPFLQQLNLRHSSFGQFILGNS